MLGEVEMKDVRGDWFPQVLSWSWGYASIFSKEVVKYTLITISYYGYVLVG